MYYIGVMSGTSLDGIDAVLAQEINDNLQIIETISENFPDDLKEELKSLLKTFTIHLKNLGKIQTYLSYCYAETINKLIEKSGVNRKEINAIGCHGQTIFHDPRSKYPFSMQIGNGNIIAAETGITTIMDFRGMDIALGGDGAPLAPGFHQDCFFSDSENRVILNLGGIANITIINSDPNKVIGFDTGPANCLMDLWIQYKLGKKYDKNGEWAKTGKVNNNLLKSFLNECYFNQEPPKSTGKELFNLDWLNNKLNDFSDIRPEDIQATLCELTAKSIADEVLKHAPEVNAVYSCGGGAFNNYFQKRLSHYLPGVKVSTTIELGIAPQWVESIAFAWLARQRFEKKTGNIPRVTGAKKSAILGSVYIA